MALWKQSHFPELSSQLAAHFSPVGPKYSAVHVVGVPLPVTVVAPCALQAAMTAAQKKIAGRIRDLPTTTATRASSAVKLCGFCGA
jgi:hypothetical protein